MAPLIDERTEAGWEATVEVMTEACCPVCSAREEAFSLITDAVLLNEENTSVARISSMSKTVGDGGNGASSLAYERGAKSVKARANMANVASVFFRIDMG